MGLLTVLIGTSPGLTQIQKSPLLRTFPGWGVQTWSDDGTPWTDLAAEAFHFSPDGSFYEVSDEGTILRIAVTVQVKQAVTKHKIPIDGGGFVQVVVDGIPQIFVVGGYEVPFFVNEHRVVELDLSPGKHTVEMVNYSGFNTGELDPDGGRQVPLGNREEDHVREGGVTLNGARAQSAT